VVAEGLDHPSRRPSSFTCDQTSHLSLEARTIIEQKLDIGPFSTNGLHPPEPRVDCRRAFELDEVLDDDREAAPQLALL
jgi:hypothetical protein